MVPTHMSPAEAAAGNPGLVAPRGAVEPRVWVRGCGWAILAGETPTSGTPF